MFRYVSPLIVVKDIAASRQFYEQCLGQKIRYDFGVDIQFEGDFSIHQRAHFLGLLGDEQRFTVTPKSNSTELYFETDDIEAAQARLRQADAEFVHAVQEQPWGQRVMRVYDPDGHILEIGETLDAAMARLYQQGLSVEEIHRKTGMPVEEVTRAVQGAER